MSSGAGGAAKAVILARGLGTRMRRGDDAARLDAAQAAAADAGLKAMIPIGRPFLDYVLSALADAGIRDVCLVVGPGADVIREHYDRPGVTHRLRLSFAIQDKAIGTADALLAAEAFTGGEPFLVLNADNYYPPDVLAALRVLPPPALPAFDRRALIEEGNVPPERIASFGLLDIAPDGNLRRLTEKPDADELRTLGADRPVSMNCWLFDARIFEACRDVAPSTRGELELPQAVQLAIDRGMRIRTIPVAAPVLDLSRRSDIPAVAARLAAVLVRL